MKKEEEKKKEEKGEINGAKVSETKLVIIWRENWKPKVARK